jgi:hypothetical protein
LFRRKPDLKGKDEPQRAQEPARVA